MNVKTERAALLASAKSVALRAQDQNRNLTPAETTEINAAVARIGELDAKAVRAGEHAAQLASITRTAPDGATGHLGLTGDGAKALAGTLAARMMPEGAKALLPAGSIVGDVPMGASPVSLGYAARGLLNVLPSVVTAPTFAYLRQLTRTNNAAPVASGALKPTSPLTLSRVEGRLRVIAHLSEAVDSYWLSDNASLQSFVSSELVYGIAQAVETQVLSGSGVGENLTGFANVSGIQVQAYATSPIITARTALTKVESLYGTASGYFVLSPADWQTIETATLTAGAYVLADAGQNVPVNSAARRLWGQPVYTTTGQAAGTGWFVNTDACALNTDGAVQVKWSESTGEDFSRNQVRARVEGRFDLSVYKPAGIVKLTLTGV